MDKLSCHTWEEVDMPKVFGMFGKKNPGSVNFFLEFTIKTMLGSLTAIWMDKNKGIR